MLSTQQIGLLFIYSGTYARCFLLLEIWSTSGELDSETVIVVPLCVWRFLISIQCYLAANRNWFCFHTIERQEHRVSVGVIATVFRIEYCMQQIAFIHCPGKIEWNREIWQANLAEQYHSFLLQLLNINLSSGARIFLFILEINVPRVQTSWVSLTTELIMWEIYTDRKPTNRTTIRITTTFSFFIFFQSRYLLAWQREPV